MSPVTVTFSFSAHTRAIASQVNKNFADILATLNGGITDALIAAGADIDGNKLSSTPSKQVPNSKLGNNAVDARVLASDPASPGSDSSRAVSGDHIRALTVAQIARIIAASSITNSMLQGPITAFITAGSIGEDKLKVTIHVVNGIGGTVNSTTGYLGGTAVPTVNFPVATYDCLGAFLKKTSGANAVASIFPTNAGANWSANVDIFGQAGGTPGTWGGSAFFVFIQKT